MKEYTVIYEHGANNWSAYAPDPSNRSRHSFRVSDDDPTGHLVVDQRTGEHLGLSLQNG